MKKNLLLAMLVFLFSTASSVASACSADQSFACSQASDCQKNCICGVGNIYATCDSGTCSCNA